LKCTDTNKTEWKAALYSRLSREDGDKGESESITNQRDLMKAFVQARADIEIYDTYEDDGFSGGNLDRPAFQRMMEDARGGKINLIISKDLSRLGRNYIETGRLIERIFPFLNVRYIAILDNYDSLQETDNLLIPVKNLFNDAFLADTSRKIRSQLSIKRQKGEFIGPFTAYGYHKDPLNHNKLVVDENAAQIVRDVFKWKIKGMSQQGIADKLNGLGVLCPLEHKKSNGSKYTTVFNVNSAAKWTAVAVGRILKNEIYIGNLTQGVSTTPNYKIKRRIPKPETEWVRIEGALDAIVSRDDFELVNSLLKKDTRIAAGNNLTYLFSGMLICGDCGESLVRKNVPAGGNNYIYYICSTHKKTKACSSHNISEKTLAEAILAALRQHIESCACIIETLKVIKDMPIRKIDARKIEGQISDKEAELQKIDRRKRLLYENLSDGLITKEEYLEYKADFNRQIEIGKNLLENLQKRLEDISSNGIGRNQWAEYFLKHHNLESLNRTVLVELVEHIVVFERGRLEIQFRFQAEYDNVIDYIGAFPAEQPPDREVV